MTRDAHISAVLSNTRRIWPWFRRSWVSAHTYRTPDGTYHTCHWGDYFNLWGRAMRGNIGGL